jgi:hypothetical protein
MVSWIGAQSHVKSFAETKLLLAAHRLAQALRSWSRFSKEEVFQRVRRFAQANYARKASISALIFSSIKSRWIPFQFLQMNTNRF